MIEELSIVEVWNRLNKIDNQIDYIQTEIANNYNISASKLKEVLVSCSSNANSNMINSIIRTDKLFTQLRKLYVDRNNCENYIYKEIDRMKLSEPALTIAFMKDYKRMTWNQIAKEMDYSVAQVRRYCDEYKGKTPKNNNFVKDEQK